MKSARAVPLTDATVTVVWLLPAFKPAAWPHTTVVPLAHDVVLQSASAILAVAVASSDAKLRPLIVADAPPLVGALPWPTTFHDTDGASCGATTSVELTIRQNRQQQRKMTNTCEPSKV